MTPKEEANAARMAQQLAEVVKSFNPARSSELWGLIAQERKIKYEAHLKAGFTEAQALHLCATN